MAELGTRLFHYTIGEYLPAIVESGAIRVADANVASGERLCVWLSLHPEWEETANKAIVVGGERRGLSRDETLKLGGGLARIEVQPEAAPHKWQSYLRLSGVKPKLAKAMADIGMRSGSGPAYWRVSFGPIPKAQWIAIEINHGTGWVAWEP